MGFHANTYRFAAEERLREAHSAHEQKSFVLAHYLSGVAVECMFRAYLARNKRPFDARHDLRKLSKSSGFEDDVPESGSAAIFSALAELRARWKNSHRYSDLKDLNAFVRTIEWDRKIKGDRVKYSSARALASAGVLVNMGVKLWKP